MGLHFDHGKGHWSYTGFNEFRKRLASQIGIDLDQMHGFRPWRCEPARPFADIPWSTVSDPIALLLNHSDCDGELAAHDCRTVGPRLRELVGMWEADDYDRVHGLLLAGAMDECAASGESLRFR